MLPTVTCPHCKRTLAINSEFLGTAVQCPLCRQEFIPAAGSPAPPAPARPPAPPSDSERHPTYGVQEGQPVPSLTPPGEPGQAFADRSRIDLSETHTVNAPSAAEANRRLAAWK